MLKKKNIILIIKWFSLLSILSIVSFMILVYTHSTSFSFFDSWTTTSQSSDPIFASHNKYEGPGNLQIHTLQILITFFGGGALGVAGALLQKVTKNRLAEVSILGIGSLNILFIYIYATTFKQRAFSGGTIAYIMPILLIFVSIFGTLIIWAISRSKRSNKNTFIIIGIALQLFVEALSVIIVNPTKLNLSSSTGGGMSDGKKIWQKIQGYTLGEVRTTGSNPVHWWLMWLAIALVTFVIIVIIFLRRKIDTYETSEELAHSTGVNTGRLRIIIYILVALLAGAASAILGTVALLGIIAPSIARILFKNKMLPMALGSFLIGGIMVTLSSFLSLQLGWGIYVGILSTAIVIPYFIFLMIREK